MRATYLALGRDIIIIAIGLGSKRCTQTSTITARDASSLRKVLLALGLPDLDLLLLAAAAQLVGLEGVLGLELGAPVLGDVPIGHDCSVRGVDVPGGRFYRSAVRGSWDPSLAVLGKVER